MLTFFWFEFTKLPFRHFRTNPFRVLEYIVVRHPIENPGVLCYDHAIMFAASIACCCAVFWRVLGTGRPPSSQLSTHCFTMFFSRLYPCKHGKPVLTAVSCIPHTPVHQCQLKHRTERRSLSVCRATVHSLISAPLCDVCSSPIAPSLLSAAARVTSPLRLSPLPLLLPA